MRQLPSESIDLIYIDPPFFSGRNYNVIFGDKNEVRSFSDIWEGGMPGYLVWLNARLYEMKRLLKPTGSIYVHLDWHAVHYVKVEMDKIFGIDNFRNEIIWHYNTGGKGRSTFLRKHDTIFWYSKSQNYVFNRNEVAIPRKVGTAHLRYGIDEDGREFYEDFSPRKSGKQYRWYLDEGLTPMDVWIDIQAINPSAHERIGYPTQKPEALLERIIIASSNEGDVIADFFCGGGTTPAVAQRLKRRWIACDQSRIAVALTADRIVKTVEEKIGTVVHTFPVPDFTVEHWGVYEIPALEGLDDERFRKFVVRAFGGKPESVSPDIHGIRHGVPLYVGGPSRVSRITRDDVARFAKAIFEERRTNAGTMLAWNFAPDARRAAEILAARENKRIDFVRLDLIRLESEEFRQHVVMKSHEYGDLLYFIQPPEVRVSVRQVGLLTYEFDVSESVSLNKEGHIANVQWDFDYRGSFTSTQGYAFLRDKRTGKPLLVVQYTFPKAGHHMVACSVQDDQGGERMQILEMAVA